MLTTVGVLDMDLSAATLTLPDGTTVRRVEGITFNSGSADDDLISSNDTGGQATNRIFGGFGADTLHAASNGATLDGGFGLDKLLGGAGDDRLVGGFGADNDVLKGGGGNDTLIGMIGRDKLTGGGGADHFTLAAYYESGLTDTSRDLILDFNRSQGDRIDLLAVDADTLTLGDQKFRFIGTDAFGEAARELRYETFDLAGSKHDYTLVSGDINGDGNADFVIELAGLFALRGTDFVL
jgi:Ca2+-binding RTX toxin-like protein